MIRTFKYNLIKISQISMEHSFTNGFQHNPDGSDPYLMIRKMGEDYLQQAKAYES